LLENKVLCEAVDDDTASLPKFEFEVGEFMRRLEAYLGLKGISVYLGGCRIVGSAAQNVLLGEESVFKNMNDLDITFYIAGDPAQKFPELCRSMQELVAGFIAENRACVSYEDVSKYYLREFSWIENEYDAWCLCSLGSSTFSLDIKFIWSLQRKYAFSLDSFEIIVDDLLHGYQVDKIPVECTYGNFSEAMYHLREGIIFTRDPQSIFRGCLRYCLQLAKGKTVDVANRNDFNTAFSENFWSSFGWVTPQFFRKVISRFLSHHPHDKELILTQLEELVSYNDNPASSTFLLVLQQLH